MNLITAPGRESSRTPPTQLFTLPLSFENIPISSAPPRHPDGPTVAETFNQFLLVKLCQPQICRIIRLAALSDGDKCTVNYNLPKMYNESFNQKRTSAKWRFPIGAPEEACLRLQ